jgi:molybdopterin biosynthesis enzyme
MMLPLAKADCLIIREAYDPPAKAGDACRIVKFER